MPCLLSCLSEDMASLQTSCNSMLIYGCVAVMWRYPISLPDEGDWWAPALAPDTHAFRDGGPAFRHCLLWLLLRPLRSLRWITPESGQQGGRRCVHVMQSAVWVYICECSVGVFVGNESTVQVLCSMHSTCGYITCPALLYNTTFYIIL